MQIELARVELKEILANLMPTCEPEVRQKLIAALDAKVLQVEIPYDGGNVRVLREPSSIDDLRVVVRQANADAENDAYRPLTREKDFPKGAITDEELERINTQRRVAFEAAARMKAARAGHMVQDMAEVQTPPRIGNVAVGANNRYGDRCVKVDEAGQSVFVCAQGHGYVEAGLLTSGCPRCWSGASEGGGMARVQMDDEDATVEAF